MSKPDLKSSRILLLPKGLRQIEGCITTDLTRNDYRVDLQGRSWYYVSLTFKGRKYDGWILFKKVKITKYCCQA